MRSPHRIERLPRSDNTASHRERAARPETIADLLEGLQPIGDLEQLAIDDLTADEADAYFRILEQA